MTDAQTHHPRIPMQVTSGYVVASIQADLTAGLLRQFQHDLLERVQSSGAPAVILDVSGVEVMDLDDFQMLRRTMDMVSVMGARPVLVGLRPGIVASLIGLDGDVDGIEATADLDDALQRLQLDRRVEVGDSLSDNPTESAGRGTEGTNDCASGSNRD